jgi:hypothetical protein
MRWVWVISLFTLFLLNSFFLLSSSQLVLASCGGPFDPPCAVCGEGGCEAGETCKNCPEDCACGPGFACLQNLADGWECLDDPSCVCGDGSCDSLNCGEDASSCFQDCCTPVCPHIDTVACNEPLLPTNGCGVCSGVGQWCDPGYECLPSPFDCCDRDCPSPWEVACGQTYTESDGCGDTCAVAGTKCYGGEWCDVSYTPDRCVECSAAAHCDDGNVCTDSWCNSGSCTNTVVPGRSCTPHGGGTGECQADGSCLASCSQGLTYCHGKCVDLQSDALHCGSCGKVCAADQTCTIGECVCSDGATRTCDVTNSFGSCSGVETCASGSFGLCDAATPAAEVCGNQIDEDCDGALDNGCSCLPGATQSCYGGPGGTAGVGVCSEGTQTCNPQGEWGTCVGAVTPNLETCNGVDDDCDSLVDADDPTMTSCGVGASCVAGACAGVSCADTCSFTCCAETCCLAGQVCGAGGCCTPEAETCNGVDDDCDGLIDASDPAMASCPADRVCTGGACVCEFDECGGVCVDVLSDEAHCGGCDNVCAAGEFCAAGSCTAVRYGITFPNSLELVAGERARLDVSLVALDGSSLPNVYWEFSSWMGGVLVRPVSRTRHMQTFLSKR